MNVDRRDKIFSKFLLQVLFFFLLSSIASPLCADRRSVGMAEGERRLVASQAPPSKDSAFYRSVERRLQSALRSLRYADHTAARIHLRWAQSKLNGHGDKDLAGKVAVILSYIRHYQINLALSHLNRLTSLVHGLGWGSSQMLEVSASNIRVHPSKDEQRAMKLLNETIGHLKAKETEAARKSLRKLDGGFKEKASKASSAESGVSRELRRLLKGLNLHFDSYLDDPRSMIDQLEEIKKELQSR